MNSRLLTATEKRVNARGRNHRNYLQKKWNRRENLLRELSLQGGADAVAVDSLASLECLQLLCGDLRAARWVARRLKIGILSGTNKVGKAGPERPVVSLTVPRPDRMVKESNRANVFPRLLRGAPPPTPGLSIQDGLAAARGLVCAGCQSHWLVDFIARSTGLEYEVTARILFRHALIPVPFSPAETQAIQRARQFWNLYDQGRFAYGRLVAAGVVAPVAGNWAWFDAAGLQELLPGLHVPLLFTRPHYLTNLYNDSGDLSLDIHSLAGLPMFKHPL